MPLEPLSDQEQQNLVSRHSESEKGQETSSLGAKFRGEFCGFLASLTAVFLHFSTTSSLSFPSFLLFLLSLPPFLHQMLFKFVCR